MAINIRQTISTQNREGSLDFRYGPWDGISEAILRAGDKITNGVTIGIKENGNIVEYLIDGYTSGNLTQSNFIKKVNDSQITIKQNGNTIGSFTLNQSNGDEINIVAEPLPNNIVYYEIINE